MDDLQSLVRRRLDDLKRTRDWSLADVAQRAKRAGYPITKGRLSQIATGVRMTRPSNADTLWALAHGLGLPIHQVADAALRSTGIPMPARRYHRGHDRATVRGVCASCPERSRFDVTVIVLPDGDYTPDEIANLESVVEAEATHLRGCRAGDDHTHDQSVT